MNREFTTIGDVNDIKGFFDKYNNVNNAHFVSLFGNITESDIKALDFILSDVFGGKVLIQKYADIFNKSGADFLMGRVVSIADKYCYDNWLSFKQSIETAFNYNLSKPLESEKTIETKKTGENETQNKLNAFDSSIASDTDRENNSYIDNYSTTETIHYNNGKTPAENAKKQIDFTKNNDLIELIINDVVSICCIDVYDDNYISCRTSNSGEINPELENRITQCENDITDIKKLIPTTATEQNKLATIADVQSGYDDTELRGLIQGNTENIQGIYNDLTTYATKQELQAVESQIPDVTNLATKSELQAVESQIPDVTNLATKSEVQAVESQIPDVTNLATKSEVQAISDLIPTNASTQNKLATMSDISGGGGSGGSYYTVGEEVDTGNIYKNGSTEKHIYRKMIELSDITTGETVDIPTSFTNETKFLSIIGSHNLNGAHRSLGYYNESGGKGVQASVTSSNIRFTALGSGLTFTDITLIIEYIK